MDLSKLNYPDVSERLAAAAALATEIKAGVSPTSEVNNHVHTIYSFSPYSPTLAAAMAARAGLRAVGIMDHDSVAGCGEMIEAGKALDIATTCGCEIRVDMTGTAVEGRKINNPDSANNIYMAFHGIPATTFKAVAEFLKPINQSRVERDKKEVEKLNLILARASLPPLDFERDIRAISQADNGGSITERHILYALSLKLIDTFGKGQALIAFVNDKMGIDIPAKVQAFLLDPENPHYAYDLLGVFKSAIVPDMFIQPDAVECVSVYGAVDFANHIGAIPVYAYLGDVGESPTGDKKAEKFEDDYLDELIPELKKIGFKAITYMPPRNTLAQLQRLQRLCRDNDLMEISGVDINSSRQAFTCPIIMEPAFQHLTEATWALIAHEKLAAAHANYALFSPENPLADRPLTERLSKYADIGRRINHRHPENVLDLVSF
ncbi:MAG: PHP domain-containing protein [Lentisphaeria bacterium]|nr:PHP domain-containing protein [Lentisphaeria bacterium]